MGLTIIAEVHTSRFSFLNKQGKEKRLLLLLVAQILLEALEEQLEKVYHHVLQKM
jgi:hypothetical protein